MVFCIKSAQLIPWTVSSLRGCIKSSLFVPVRGLIQMPIQWKRPERLRFDHPDKTGDDVTRLELDMERLPVRVEQSKELEKCNDLVKRLFSFHFLGRKYAVERAVIESVESVQNHKYDVVSLETLIAAKTVKIRNLIEHVETRNYDAPAKARLNHLIQRRRRHLRCLRKHDYKRYEWLLEKLGLVYTPIPEELYFVQRKKSIRRLTEKFCNEYKESKLAEYRQLLLDKRADFLREKVESLKWMRQEEIDCGVKPTISEADIKQAEDQLEKHLEGLAWKKVISDESRNILSDV